MLGFTLSAMNMNNMEFTFGLPGQYQPLTDMPLLKKIENTLSDKPVCLSRCVSVANSSAECEIKRCKYLMAINECKLNEALDKIDLFEFNSALARFQEESISDIRKATINLQLWLRVVLARERCKAEVEASGGSR